MMTHGIKKQFQLKAEYVLLSFSAPWCKLCHMVEPMLYRLSAEWQSPLDIVEVNADLNFDIVHTYRIQSLPTLLLLKNGLEIERITFGSSREEWIYQCEQLLFKYRFLSPLVY
jgi:thioredoxin 1